MRDSPDPLPHAPHQIDPESLVPLLPRPRELRPFPESHGMVYKGHVGKVWSVAPDPSGRWIATGGAGGGGFGVGLASFVGSI